MRAHRSILIPNLCLLTGFGQPKSFTSGIANWINSSSNRGYRVILRQLTGSRSPCATRVPKIRQLQRDLRVMLAALQNDMRQVDNQQEASSKFDRLVGHTSTMLYWSKQIQWALGIKPTALG
ncbi:hypothetical protein [Spirosoma agri]|uniref:Uncharacterized protein n=1 Tax=Spirosoma agri TaxID=1987381 RepID=A0A6M0IEU6_9BACT|nr:hypothetical protein [Spirosoma agri]NEU66302.1 hypothetical protein [Spirosoma agri]